ncbi:MAG: TldD/PmbA family protein [Clostridia bacterium]
MTQDQFVYALLDAARIAGIQEAEIYYQQSDDFCALVYEGAISDYRVNTHGGLSFRGLFNGRMGSAFTEALDEDAILLLVQGVLDGARLIDTDDVETLFAGSANYPTLDCCAAQTDDTDAKLAFALELERLAKGVDARVNQLGYTGLQTSCKTVRIVNTFGLDRSHTEDIAFALVQAVAQEGDRTTTGTGISVGRCLSELSAEKAAHDAVEEAVSMLGAKPCQSGVMPVVIRRDAMSDLLETFCGIFSAEEVQKGRSLMQERVGKAIAASCVTLIDDPLMPHGLASCPFDAEGVATYQKTLIQNGVLQTLLHNRKTAAKDGVATTGNASREGYGGGIHIAPTNLFLQPGREDLDALCARIGDGLLLTEVSGLHAGANAISGDFSLLSKGFLLHNGCKTQPVEQITVAGNFYTLLRDITALGNDLWFGTNTCGCPSVSIKSLSIAGSIR